MFGHLVDRIYPIATKDNNYVVNQKLEHVDDISFIEIFGRIKVVFNKIRYVPS
jgi:hypothetical protein